MNLSDWDKAVLAIRYREIWTGISIVFSIFVFLLCVKWFFEEDYFAMIIMGTIDLILISLIIIWNRQSIIDIQ